MILKPLLLCKRERTIAFPLLSGITTFAACALELAYTARHPY